MLRAWSRRGSLCPHRENLPENKAEPTKRHRGEFWWHRLNPQFNCVWSQRHHLDYLITLANNLPVLQAHLSWVFHTWNIMNTYHYYIQTLPACKYQRSIYPMSWSLFSTGETIYWTHNTSRLKEYISTPERFHGSPDLLNSISFHSERQDKLPMVPESYLWPRSLAK